MIETTTHPNGVTIEIIRDLWLCQCCTLLHANGECGCDEQDEHVEAMINHLEPDNAAGWYLASDSADEDDEDDCDFMEFTWATCDGCGSHLGGSRSRHSLIRRTSALGGAK